MSSAIYEFPLKEKVRNYLRIEQLLNQLKTGAQNNAGELQRYFFEQLFTLFDLFERLDIRNDLLKELDNQEKNLVVWSQHPQINNEALQSSLERIVVLKENIRKSKKFSSFIREDKFLTSIKQRFSIPGGTCAFDLPNLHFWLNQSEEKRNESLVKWMSSLAHIEDAIAVTLSFLRQTGKFQEHQVSNGYYQGSADDKAELIRVECDVNQGFYPVLSGNKYRYALRFMWFSPTETQSAAVETSVTFKIASC